MATLALRASVGPKAEHLEFAPRVNPSVESDFQQSRNRVGQSEESKAGHLIPAIQPHVPNLAPAKSAHFVNRTLDPRAEHRCNNFAHSSPHWRAAIDQGHLGIERKKTINALCPRLDTSAPIPTPPQSTATHKLRHRRKARSGHSCQ